MKKDIIMKYRDNLVNYGRRVCTENPDRLNDEQLKALTARIFSELNNIDMAMGYEYHDTGVTCPQSISKEEQKGLFVDFIDWYDVIPTLSNSVYQYVLKKYPAEKYPKVLCVGDGKKCHLGRKLAMKGYDVVSVDPVAQKQFTGKQNGKGKLYVVNAEFFDTSKDMIDWASVVVGTKVPLCAEDLVKIPKPTVFNISNNVEIYNMRFKGVPIKSSAQLQDEIKKCSGVKCLKHIGTRIEDEDECVIFVRDVKEKSDAHKNR